MIVLDVNAAAGLCRNPKEVLGFFDRFGDEKIISPKYFRVEAAQVAWKYVHSGIDDKKAARPFMECMFNYVDEFVDDGDLFVEALNEAVNLDHSFYDMLYLVLARRTASPLVTCDKRLVTLCRDCGVECVELIDL